MSEYGKEVWREETLKPLQVEKEHLQPIRFQGQSFDEETGLHYNRFRYYDPDMGMFTTRDPIGLRGGDNIFQYAPNPTGWIDPLGLVTRKQAIRSLEKDSNVTPGISARVTMRGTKKAQYTNKQINSRWADMEDAYLSRVIKAGMMTPCPSKAPTACVSCSKSDEWRKYGGDSKYFHCGFDGYLENRIPGENDNPAPANECFYDKGGELVTESHEYGGCRGTPDYYPYYNDGTNADSKRATPHTFLDAGGISGPSRTHYNLASESYAESIRYSERNLAPAKKRNYSKIQLSNDIHSWLNIPTSY